MTDWDDTTIAQLPEERPEPPTSRDRAYLIVLSGSKVGEMYKIDKNEIVIGRGPTADLRFLDDGVSRLHCRIRLRDEQLVVEDLDSRNGTYCNGDQITNREIKDGDKIQLGRTTILKFTYHDQLDETFQQQMFNSALRDGLTRAYNKKYFMDRLDSEFQFAMRHRSPLALLMMDLDHFKEVNDTYGHLAGDKVLTMLADYVHGSVRNEDVFARYGGEEFAIISRSISQADAIRFAERVRHEIEHMRVIFDGVEIPVTCSIGVATVPEDSPESASALIALADGALYQAKAAGRNRVCASEQDANEETSPE